jgi:anti-sigma regulatory factor (Ser/Thr protein kinase)
VNLPPSRPRPDLDAQVEVAPQELRLDLPAAHAAARMARHLVRQFARAGGLPEGELDQLTLVADELLTNAVDHGGGGAALEEAEHLEPSRMHMLLYVSADAWEMHVADQGGGDPEVVRAMIAPPDGVPDLEDERGRGFFLMAQLVDSLEVRRSEDGLGLEMIARRRAGQNP